MVFGFWKEGFIMKSAHAALNRRAKGEKGLTLVGLLVVETAATATMARFRIASLTVVPPVALPRPAVVTLATAIL